MTALRPTATSLATKLTIGAAALVALAGCTTTSAPIDVTRFHTADTAPIYRGTVAVEAMPSGTVDRPFVLGEADGDAPAAQSGLEQRIYERAVLDELREVGYAAGGATSDYLVRVGVEQSRLSASGARSPVSVGVGGRTGGYFGSGVGLGIGLNLGGGARERVVTDMMVRIARRSTGDVVWEGRASLPAAARSDEAQPAVAAARLAEALFVDFPGRSGETITVR